MILPLLPAERDSYAGGKKVSPVPNHPSMTTKIPTDSRSKVTLLQPHFYQSPS